MLKIDDRLGSYNIAAGEPWIMSVQMRAMQGSAIINWSARRLTLSFYKPSRELVDQIEGVYTSDASGAYFAFVRDGRFSESLYGQSLQVELAERLLEGRAIISTGPLAIVPSSNGVSSFGSVIGRVDARFTLYFDNAGLIALIEQDLLPYGGTPVTPAPVITTPAAISNDGTPQIGETFTGVLPTGTGFRTVTPAWLRGTTVLSTPGTSPYVGDFAGDLTFEATITGNDGSTVRSRSTITINAATPTATVDNTLANDSTVLASSVSGFAALVDPLDARLTAGGN